MAEPLRYADRHAPGSGEPDAQGARPCPLHPQTSAAAPPPSRVERRSLPTVAAGLAGLGFTGSFLSALGLVTLLGCVVCAATAAAAAPARPPRDHGPTLPIESFLAERQPEGGGVGAGAELVSDMAVAYPVATRGLRAATLQGPASLPSAYGTWLTQPIALIADDAVSRRWLSQQGDALNALGAAILVVRVKSRELMRALRAHRPDLAMAPAAVPELVAALRGANAAVYPLVILTDGSVRQDVRSIAPVPPAPSPAPSPSPRMEGRRP